MPVRAGVLLAVLLCLFGVSGCDAKLDTGAVVQPHAGHDGLPDQQDNGNSTVAPSGFFSFDPVILPIHFSIDTAGHFSISVSSKIVTPIGDISFGASVAQRSGPDGHGESLAVNPYGTTRLIICRQGSARQTCKGYDINTGRKLDITMDGHYEETVERNQITIDAGPGSTLTVTDAHAPSQTGPRPAARIDIEEFDFRAQGPDTEVDLERSLGGTTPDLSYDHMTGELKPINRAMISRIKQYAGVKHGILADSLPTMDLPGENDCAQTTPSDWKPGFSASDLQADVILACIGTAEGDYGYVVIGRDTSVKPVAYYTYTYTWVR